MPKRSPPTLGEGGSQAKKAKENSNIRATCFTINNYGVDDVERLISLAYCGTTNMVSPDIRFMVFGFERGDDKKTPHIQGYVGWTTRKTFSTVKRLVGEKAHIENAKGTAFQNWAYCTKDGNFFVFGEKPEQGKRNDLLVIAEELRKGRSLEDVANEFPVAYMRNHRGIRDWITLQGLEADRDFKTEVHVHIGPPGVGKSRYCAEQAKSFGNVYYKRSGEWFQRFKGEKSVIMDDFYGGYPFHELLAMLDRYPYWVSVKNGDAQFAAERVYITSNKMPREWYDREKFKSIEALYRRFTTCTVWVDKDNKRQLIWQDDDMQCDNEKMNVPIPINY